MKVLKSSTKTTILSIIVLTFLFLLVSVNAMPFIAGNETCRAYPEQCEISTNKGPGYNSLTVGQLVIIGGENLLYSHSAICRFSGLIERSELYGPDFEDLKLTLDQAIEYMENARLTYFQLKTLASGLPYNQYVIEKLKNLDYQKFQSDRGLIASLFTKVQDLLKNGDVTGVFIEFYNYSCGILDYLYVIKNDIDENRMPDISKIWRVNQNYSEFRMFGQYVAEVFLSL